MTQTTIRKLYVLDFGLFQVHENGRIIGIPGFLIQTSDGKNILVDTGFPASYADDPEAASAVDGLDSFGKVLRLTAENLPEAQLAKCGLKKADITHLIMTHSDIDHVGALHDFPQAEMIIGQAERALPRPRYFGFDTISTLTWPVHQPTRLIDSDCELCPGLTILTTPGHSPGHISLLLTLPQTGTVILTGDAISRPAEIEEGFVGYPQIAQVSAARIMKLAAELNAFLIYGHDPAQWDDLRKAPAWYE